MEFDAVALRQVKQQGVAAHYDKLPLIERYNFGHRSAGAGRSAFIIVESTLLSDHGRFKEWRARNTFHPEAAWDVLRDATTPPIFQLNPSVRLHGSH